MTGEILASLGEFVRDTFYDTQEQYWAGRDYARYDTIKKKHTAQRIEDITTQVVSTLSTGSIEEKFESLKHYAGFNAPATSPFSIPTELKPRATFALHELDNDFATAAAHIIKQYAAQDPYEAYAFAAAALTLQDVKELTDGHKILNRDKALRNAPVPAISTAHPKLQSAMRFVRKNFAQHDPRTADHIARAQITRTFLTIEYRGTEDAAHHEWAEAIYGRRRKHYTGPYDSALLKEVSKL